MINNKSIRNKAQDSTCGISYLGVLNVLPFLLFFFCSSLFSLFLGCHCFREFLFFIFLIFHILIDLGVHKDQS